MPTFRLKSRLVPSDEQRNLISNNQPELNLNQDNAPLYHVSHYGAGGLIARNLT
jgi:hypothetical protein